MPDKLNHNTILNEFNIRNRMKDFSTAIWKSEVNTDLLLTEDPWDISYTQFGGNQEDKMKMSNFCEYLEFVKMITKDENVYKEQFLKPVELSAQYLKNTIRGIKGKRSVGLDGWIFATSKPSKTDKRAENRNVTVSAVFPQLQTVMSVSVEENSTTKKTLQYHEFKNCQPIPLTNRIFQTKGSTDIQEEKTVMLSEFDFLFTSFSDIKLLGKSVEMENFCEADSKQSEIKQHLAYPFVSFGKVMPSTRGAKMQIKSIVDDSNQKFSISEHYNFKENNPDKLREKYVRFFGVTWYDTNDEGQIKLEKSEIFLAQEEKDVERLRFENMLGHVRLRTSVSKLEVQKILGQEVKSEEDCIEIDSNNVKFRYSIPEEYIPKEFVKTTLEIRELRSKYKQSSPIVSKEQLIDPEKLAQRNLKGLVKRVKTLFDILIQLQNEMDVRATIDKKTLLSIFKSKNQDEELIKKRFRWLKFLKLIEEDEINVQLTKLGKDVLLECCADNFAELCKSKEVIKLEDVEKYQIPTSVFSQYLKNTDEFHPLKLNDNVQTATVWIKKGNDRGYEEVLDELVKKREKILEIMGSVRYPVTVQMLSEYFERDGNHLGSFIISELLTEIKETGEVRSSGDSWEYPVHARIHGLFKKYPDDWFDVEVICKKCLISKEHNWKVEKYLSDFEETGNIKKNNGKWISSLNFDKNKDELKKFTIREIVRNNVKRSIPPKTETISDSYWKKQPTNYHLGNQFVSKIQLLYLSKNHESVTDEEIRHEIELMIKEGHVPTEN
ncbi:MAG: hypothetical protein HOD60_08625 [Candidatus Nitrosopelagicus sp.]|nr:hypothetical protein [Candidatus Nitrosopelagicus sp.]